MNLLSVFLFLLIASSTCFKQSQCYLVYASPSAVNRPCRPRDVCVKALECPFYIKLLEGLKRPLTPVSLVYLRHQECGADGFLPMVCCLAPVGTPEGKEQRSKKNDQPPAKANFSDSFSSTTPKAATTTRKPSMEFSKWRLDDQLRENNRRSLTERTKDEELKRKMEAIDRSFMASWMDDLFVRGMSKSAATGDSNKTNKERN